MAGDKNKHTIWALLLSLLALTTSFQYNYHNNQLVVTPNEVVGVYCRDQPLNDPPLFLSVFFFFPSTRIFLAKAVYMVLGSARKILVLGRSQLQEQVQPFACKPNTEKGIWRKDDLSSRIFLVLGCSSLHVNSPLVREFQHKRFCVLVSQCCIH